jgi:[acyl-carrier-protein] S-malonyltransferase
VELAVSLAKEHGIRRATLLKVAGAYHSRLMNSAYEQLGEPLLDANLQLPRFAVLSNVTGEPAGTLPEIRSALREQVTSTVRWADCMENLLGRGCDLFIELGPGEVLAGLLRRICKDVDVTSVNDPASVQACAERLRQM